MNTLLNVKSIGSSKDTFLKMIQSRFLTSLTYCRRTKLLTGLSKVVILASMVLLNGCFDSNNNTEENVARHIKQANAYLLQGQYRAATIEARNAIQKDSSNIDGHIAMSKVSNDLGRYKQSVTHLEQLPEAAYQNIDFLYTLVEAYLGRGKLQSASDLLNNYQSIFQQRQPDYQLLSANIQLGNNKIAEAEKTLTAVLDSNPDNVEALLLLAQMKAQQLDHDSTQSLLQRLDAISMGNPDVYYLKAQLSLASEEFEFAENYLTEAISNLPNADIMTPKKSAYLGLLTQILTIQGKSAEALIYTQKIAEAFPGAELAEGEFREASTLFDKGELAAAEVVLEKLLNEYPNFEDAAVLLAVIKYRNDDVEAASNYFGDRVDAEISDPKVTKLAAMAGLRNNQPERVVELLEQYSRNNDDAQILVLYGQAALSTGKHSAAEQALKRAISIDPSLAQAYLVLAKLYNSSSPANADQALNILREGYAKNADQFGIAAGLARQLVLNGNANEAWNIIEEILATHNQDVTSLQLAGDFFYNQQQMDKANDYYNQVLAKDPSNFESAAKLAFIAEQVASHQDSLAAWRRAAVIAPDDPLPLEQMLASASSTGETVNAEAAILDIAQANESGVPYAVLAMYFADRGVLSKAKDYEAKLISRSPDAALLKSVKLSIYYAIAKTEYIAKNFPAARENALSGLSLEARSPLLLILLTEIEVADKNYTEAQKLVDQIRAGNELIGNELQGDLYMVQSQAAPAVEVYRSVWQRQTSNKLAAKLYASLSASDADQAQVFLAEWNAKYPRSSSALGARATNYLLAGEFNNAIPIMETIQSITPDSPLNLNNLAWAYHQVNNAKALPTAKRAYELAPKSASIADTYGWILFRQGNISEAVEVLEKAASMEPDNTEIAAHLQDAKKAQ